MPLIKTYRNTDIQPTLGVGDTKQNGSNAYGGDNLSCSLPTSQRPDADSDDIMPKLFPSVDSASMPPKANDGDIIYKEEHTIENQEVLPSVTLQHSGASKHDFTEQNESLPLVSPEQWFNPDQIDEEGCTSLYKAASRGHLTKVMNLVEKGADPNKANEDGRRALHVAAEKGHKSTVKFLVYNGADVNAECDLGQTPLHAAINSSQSCSKSFLISNGADVKKRDKAGRTALHMAAAAGIIHIFENLTDETCDINEQDDMGLTVLHHAVRNGHFNIVNYLLEKGAKKTPLGVPDFLIMQQAKITKYDGKGVLHLAAIHGDQNILRYFVKMGADVSELDDSGQTPLHVAAGMGHLDIMKYLIEQGSKIDKHDHCGYTPLHIAAAKGYLEIVKYLTDQKCSVKEVDNAGLTPLSLAAKHGHLDTVKYLADGRVDEKAACSVACRSCHRDIVEFFTYRILLRSASSHGDLDTLRHLLHKGFDINSCFGKGWTPLDYAIQNDKSEVIDYLLTNGTKANQCSEEGPLYMASRLGHLDAVKLLISRGISVNAESHKGQIPLHAAAATGRIQLVKILIENGSDLNKTDMDGSTPVHAAVQNGHLEVAKYLMRKGAIDIKNRGMTSLYTAAQSNHLDGVDLFLSYGTDLNEEDDTRGIPLHAAAANGSLEMAEILINHGSNETKMADNGWTPLHAVVYGGRFSDINGESYSPMPSNDTDASFSLQDFWRKNLDTLPRHIKTAICRSRESCVAKPKTQFHGGELPATDDWPITSENDAVDSKPGIKSERRNIENFFSIFTAIHRAILALTIFFACTPVLVAGNVKWVEPVTLDVGTRGVVPFYLKRPSSTLKFSLYYTIQFGSKGRPFCINGQYDVDGFKDPSQISRFTTTVSDRDTSPCVNVTIDDVNTIDGDQYIFTALWRSLENVLHDTQKKEVIVQRSPGPADCFITLSDHGDNKFPYELHCSAKTGSMPSTLTCFQNDRELVKVQNITDKRHTTRGIFFLPYTTHFSCCSHDITSRVGAATCNDFEWPPGYSGIPSTEKTTNRSANRPTNPTTITNRKSNVGSGACRPFMIPSQWHFLYLLIYLLVFVINMICYTVKKKSKFTLVIFLLGNIYLLFCWALCA